MVHFYSRVLLLSLWFTIRCVKTVIELKLKITGGHVFRSDRRSVPNALYFCTK